MDPDRCNSIEASIEVLSDALEGHITRFAIHEEQEKVMHEATQHNRTLNTEAINNLTVSQKELADAQKEQTHSTQGLVTAWESVSALVDGLNTVGRIAKWVGGIAGAIVAILSLYAILSGVG